MSLFLILGKKQQSSKYLQLRFDTCNMIGLMAVAPAFDYLLLLFQMTISYFVRTTSHRSNLDVCFKYNLPAMPSLMREPASSCRLSPLLSSEAEMRLMSASESFRFPDDGHGMYYY